MHARRPLLGEVEVGPPDPRAVAEQPEVVAGTPFVDGALEHRLRIAQRLRQRITARRHRAYNFAVMVHRPIIYRPLPLGERSMSNSDDETGQNVLLALVFGLVAIVV